MLVAALTARCTPSQTRETLLSMLLMCSLNPCTSLCDARAQRARRLAESTHDVAAMGRSLACLPGPDPISGSWRPPHSLRRSPRCMLRAAQGFSDDYYPLWQAPQPVLGTDRGRTYIVSPMVRDYVQRFFNCCDVPGAELEDDGGQGSAGSHWEARIFEVRAWFWMTFYLVHVFVMYVGSHWEAHPRLGCSALRVVLQGPVAKRSVASDNIALSRPRQC
jgi:Leishmanolysin